MKTIQEQRKTGKNKKGKENKNDSKEMKSNDYKRNKQNNKTKSLKTKKIKLHRTRTSDSDVSEGELSYAETDDSPWEEQEEYLELQPVEPNNLKEGKFAIVGFKGGNRKTVLYKYLCVILRRR